jgi:hypothetical protein
MFDGHIPHYDPHQVGEGQDWCEFERTLKGEYCTENGEVRLDGLMLCNRHAGLLRLEERMAYWKAMLAHVELWSGEARRRGRADVVRLLEIERARASAALGRTSEDLEELELAPIGEQLFTHGNSERDCTALCLLLDTYATRLLAEPLRGKPRRG